MTDVTVCDGKYTVEWGPGQPLRALRYGEPWRDCCGDGLILALAQEIDDLRSAARTDAGYGAGFEACREAAKEVALHRARVWKKSDGKCSMSLWDECTDIAAAIAALPTPSGESVTVEELADAVGTAYLKAFHDKKSWEELARALLSTFAITRKSQSEERS
jgi:hypothetical protein